MKGKLLAGALSLLCTSLAKADNWSEFLVLSLEKQVRAEVDGFLPSPIPEGGIISSKFGERLHPVYNQIRQHNGIDIVSEIGTSFVSVSDGEVVYTGFTESQGNFVIIQHTSNVKTLYAHAQSTLVNTGETVSKGQVIGTVGNTGLVTGAHLHVELIVWGSFYDPLIFMETQSNTVVGLEGHEETNSKPPDIVSTSGVTVKIRIGNRTVWSIASELVNSVTPGDIQIVIDEIVKLNPKAFPTGDPSYRYADIELLLPDYSVTAAKSSKIEELALKKRTTWSISGDIGIRYGVTRYQAMKGLYDMNQAAFIDRDINRRRADIALTIPAPEYLKSIPPEVAYSWFEIAGKS